METSSENNNLEHVKSSLHFNPIEKEIVGAFFNAIKNDNLEMTKLLTNKISDVSKWTVNNDTMLDISARNSLEITKFLLRKKYNFNKRAIKSAYQKAINSGNLKTAHLLLNPWQRSKLSILCTRVLKPDYC